jgi:hypothetical protein
MRELTVQEIESVSGADAVTAAGAAVAAIGGAKVGARFGPWGAAAGAAIGVGAYLLGYSLTE